ncbi:MAG: hypothetical protein JW395_0468 [Nitrospira sp.]|nr:hypothetical protein [Nitrospira sp.]
MNSALSHNLDLAIRRSAPAFKINADEVSRRLLAVLFPVPTVTLPMAPPPVAAPAPVAAPKPTGITFTPTLTKKFAEIEKEFKLSSGDRKTEFKEYVNQMAPKEYAAKTPQEHMREFLKPKPQQPSNAAAACASISAPPPKPEMVEINENCVQVLYKGREYWVGEDSKRVYLTSAEGVDEFVGQLGLAEFDGMEMPVDEV